MIADLRVRVINGRLLRPLALGHHERLSRAAVHIDTLVAGPNRLRDSADPASGEDYGLVSTLDGDALNAEARLPRCQNLEFVAAERVKFRQS